MNEAKAGTEKALKRYSKLSRELSRLGLISQGSVLDRSQGAGQGSYQWTRKVAKKTVTVSLNREQYELMKEAIGNKRRLTKIVAEMEKESRRIIFAKAPDHHHRKPLSKKVLGII
jgi:cyclopropane fatty-acyl-phospholipid synthase-like methyltransferase